MKKKLMLVLATGLLLAGSQMQAQTFKEKMKAKIAAAEKKLNEMSSSSSSSKAEAEPEVKETRILNEWHQANEGKVVFYNTYIKYNDSDNDSQTGVITKGTIGGSQPFYLRAYLGQDFTKYCADCSSVSVRYTMGGVTITDQQIREEQSAQYYGYADAEYYYDYGNYTVCSPLTAAKGQYHRDYTLQEDTYRMLLSKIKGKLSKGATLTLKVEIIGLLKEQEQETVMASGEISLTVTDDSYNLQGLNCRCGKSGMSDQKVINDVKEAFSFQFDDIKKVNKVVLLSRDFTLVYDDSYPTKLILGKAMWANIIYERTDGVYMMVKRYVFYKKAGTGFSDKITIGNFEFFLPVSPTCAK